MFGAQRRCFTTCVLFFLCPRRSVEDDYYTGIIKPMLPIPNNRASKLMKASISTSINIKTSSGGIATPKEQGFDLSDDEIRKLKIWPGGIIPYCIDEISFDKVFRDRLRSFLDMTRAVTGILFLEMHEPPEDEEYRWVLFINRQGLLDCIDHPLKNFTAKGVQKVTIGYDCLSTGGGIAQVFMSVLGVPAQHNAPNRDEYIEIVKENIMPGKEQFFEKVNDNEWLFHDLVYDFSSASHYPLHQYSVNGKATIKPLSKVDVEIGEGTDFSKIDTLKIMMMYKFISLKRQKSINVPDCDKLFNRGSNIDNYKPESNVEDDIKPRKKPNKYLGKPDEEPNHDPKSNPDSTADNVELDEVIDEQPMNETIKETMNETNESKDKLNEKENSEDNEKLNYHNRKSTSKLSLNNDNALVLLSDYGSREYKKTSKKRLHKSTKPSG